MKKGKFIDAETRSEYHLDIKELYLKGIELIQDYCGNKWTDFNEHDPGVTILEAIVFGISDICFRLGFDTGDLLAGKGDVIDHQQQSLYRPQDILSTHPVTIDDFRKCIFDHIRDISNVWMEPIASDFGVEGRYKLLLLPRPEIQFHIDDKSYLARVKKKIIDEVWKLWPSLRNLGEDIDKEDVLVLRNKKVLVHGVVIIESKYDIEDVLAEMIEKVDSYFNPELVRSSLEDLVSEGLTMEEIFEGPFLKGGFIKAESLRKQKPRRVTKGEVVSYITEVKGVNHVQELELYILDEKENLHPVQDDVVIEPDCIPRFCFESSNAIEKGPQQYFTNKKEPGFLTVRLKKASQNGFLDVDHHIMIKKLREIQAMKNRTYDLDMSDVGANGYDATFRSLDSYTSLQNDLPYIYAVNKHGVSKYDSNERKANVLQLKAYLVLFEQILANFSSQISNLKTLFSKAAISQTYFSQPLTRAQIESIEKLYQLDSPNDEISKLDSVLEKVIEKLSDFHPHLNRKSRALDFMLALYGEKFGQSSLSRMPANEGDFSAELKMVENKALMLESLVYYNKNRSKAPPLTSHEKKDQSGFESKLAILLGIDVDMVHTKDLMSEMLKNDKYHLGLVDSDELDREPYKSWERELKVNFKNHVKNSIDLSQISRPSEKLLDTVDLMYTRLFRFHYLPDSVIRAGTSLDNYKIFRTGGDVSIVLQTKHLSKDNFYLIDTYKTAKEAVLAGFGIVDLLTQYNQTSEKFFVVDHIKLRPKEQQETITNEQKQFYEFQCSIVFPKVSTRARNEHFQALVSATVSAIIPSHILSHVLFLNLRDYELIERNYKIWRQDPSDVNSNSLAESLKSFIQYG